MLVSVTGTLAFYGWGLALGFAFSAICLFSLVALVRLRKESLGITVDRSRARAFKGEQIPASISVGLSKSWTLAQLDLMTVPEGLEARITEDGPRRMLTVKSNFAGVYKGVKVRVGVLDPLGIFERTEVHEIGMEFEFLPNYLLARPEPLRVSAAMLGDFPAGRRGHGQEFYSAEVYTASGNSRDIMWKRQAKMPNDFLMVRVGEANIPEMMTVCFIEKQDAPMRHNANWMDLASEAIAHVGLPVVASGVTMRLIHVFGDRTTVTLAKDPESLAQALMWVWREDIEKEGTELEPEDADILIASQAETATPAIMGLFERKPSVLLGWDRRRVVLGTGVVFFTGREEVGWLVAKVLSR